jgi:2,3-bisphosphoglycerate-independent phosphoglycerate mutase
MKWTVLVGDGMADRPLEALNGRTPLEVARTPFMDSVARDGMLGLVQTIPSGFPPGSDIANIVILGYDPLEGYTGRGPLEAASLGVELGPTDVAYRCNLVHLGLGEPEPKMVDFTAGHIGTDAARAVIGALDEALGDEEIRFHAGVSYRHLMVWHNGHSEVETTPPHDITGQTIGPYLPKGPGEKRLLGLIQESQSLLREPRLQGLIFSERGNAANSIWPWGQGRAPAIEPMTHRWNIKGAIITAVDLLKGIGKYAGLDIVEVPGATGYYDTDYAGKARHAIRVLEEGADFVLVHVEAPDEAGHQGDIEEKIRAIENFDRHVVGTVLEEIKTFDDWGIMILPDHATPIAVQTHTKEPVPFAVLYSEAEGGGGEGFQEGAAERSGLFIQDGKSLLGRFIEKRWG